MIMAEQKALKDRLTRAVDLDDYADFDEIDWSLAVEVVQLSAEKARLEIGLRRAQAVE